MWRYDVAIATRPHSLSYSWRQKLLVIREKHGLELQDEDFSVNMAPNSQKR